MKNQQTNYPQLEDGYLRMANELLDAFCRFRIPGGIRQIIDAIIRKTYGFNKKEDWISHSQIVEMTGMLKGNVSKGLSKAIKNRLVIKNDNKLRLNKNYSEWISFTGQHFNPKPKGIKLSNTITDNKVIAKETKVIAKETKVIVSEGNKIQYTKNNITKDNIYSKVDTLQGEDLKLNPLIGLFKQVNPTYERIYANKTQRAALERLVTKFGRDELVKIISHLHEIVSKPYAPSITTPLELEQKMGKLKLFVEQNQGKSYKFGVTKL